MSYNPNNPPPITPLEFQEADFEIAERMAARLGYEQTAYTSSSALWGLFCLQENPNRPHVSVQRRNAPPFRPGCIIKTAQFGLIFIQDCEDLGLNADGRPE